MTEVTTFDDFGAHSEFLDAITLLVRLLELIRAERIDRSLISKMETVEDKPLKTDMLPVGFCALHLLWYRQWPVGEIAVIAGQNDVRHILEMRDAQSEEVAIKITLRPQPPVVRDPLAKSKIALLSKLRLGVRSDLRALIARQDRIEHLKTIGEVARQVLRIVQRASGHAGIQQQCEEQ